MKIHHIFIFVPQESEAAEELLASGFIEGSSRIHPGQGTANRKFYFRNFYLELLWVHDQKEFFSRQMATSGLWERSRPENGFSPFGLCLEGGVTDALFSKAYPYRPLYVPNEAAAIEALKNEQQPGLPWTFRLPLEMSGYGPEPVEHLNGIRELSAADFFYKIGGEKSDFLDFFREQEKIRFLPAETNRLRLLFDNGRQGKSLRFKSLNLTIDY